MKLTELTRYGVLSRDAQLALEELNTLFERVGLEVSVKEPLTHGVEPWMVEAVRNSYHHSLPPHSPEREEYRRAVQYERAGDEIAVLRHRYEQAIAGYEEVPPSAPLSDDVLRDTFQVMVDLRTMRKYLDYTDERAEALWEEICRYIDMPPESTPTTTPNDSSEE